MRHKRETKKSRIWTRDREACTPAASLFKEQTWITYSTFFNVFLKHNYPEIFIFFSGVRSISLWQDQKLPDLQEDILYLNTMYEQIDDEIPSTRYFIKIGEKILTEKLNDNVQEQLFADVPEHITEINREPIENIKLDQIVNLCLNTHKTIVLLSNDDFAMRRDKIFFYLRNITSPEHAVVLIMAFIAHELNLLSIAEGANHPELTIESCWINVVKSVISQFNSFEMFQKSDSYQFIKIIAVIQREKLIPYINLGLLRIITREDAKREIEQAVKICSQRSYIISRISLRDPDQISLTGNPLNETAPISVWKGQITGNKFIGLHPLSHKTQGLVVTQSLNSHHSKAGFIGVTVKQISVNIEVPKVQLPLLPDHATTASYHVNDRVNLFNQSDCVHYSKLETYCKTHIKEFMDSHYNDFKAKMLNVNDETQIIARIKEFESYITPFREDRPKLLLLMMLVFAHYTRSTRIHSTWVEGCNEFIDSRVWGVRGFSVQFYKIIMAAVIMEPYFRKGLIRFMKKEEAMRTSLSSNTHDSIKIATFLIFSTDYPGNLSYASVDSPERVRMIHFSRPVISWQDFISEINKNSTHSRLKQALEQGIIGGYPGKPNLTFWSLANKRAKLAIDPKEITQRRKEREQHLIKELIIFAQGFYAQTGSFAKLPTEVLIMHIAKYLETEAITRQQIEHFTNEVIKFKQSRNNYLSLLLIIQHCNYFKLSAGLTFKILNYINLPNIPAPRLENFMLKLYEKQNPGKSEGPNQGTLAISCSLKPC